MKIILLIAAFNAFFFTVLMLQKRPRAFHDTLLVTWLIYLGMLIGTYAFYSHPLFNQHPLLAAAFIALLMLHGPFLYLYISTLVSGRKRAEWSDLLHFVPFALFILYLGLASLFPEHSPRIRMDHVTRHIDPPLLFNIFLSLTALSGPVYFLLSVRLFRKLDINIFNNYSFLEGIDLKWLRKLVAAFGLIWTALIIVLVIHHVFHLFSMEFCTDGLFLSLSAFVILVGYFGLKQRVIFSHEPVAIVPGSRAKREKYAGSKLEDHEAAQYVQQLQAHMQQEKSYLDPGLSLQQLSDQLAMPPHILSQVINDRFGQNFFDFVNSYRVEEVKHRMTDPKSDHLSLLGIAFEAGFNSKSAFNRIFLKFTGMTPTAYKAAQTELSRKSA